MTSALTFTAGASSPSVPGLTKTQVNLGAIVTQTGYATADFGAYLYGVDAYLHYVNTVLKGVNGRTLVMADPLDDQSSESQDINVARTLVTSDHVFAIVGVATAFFSASKYLSTTGTPVFGYVTQNVWQGPKNFFGDYGSVIDYASSLPDFAYVADQTKATRVAVLAYDYPSSDSECQPAVSNLKSTYGFNVVYSNMNEPVLLANFNSDVVKMANDHVNFVISCMQASDNVSLKRLMAEQGMGSVPQLWLDGYDRSTLKADASNMNNVYLMLQHVPFESYTAYPKVFPGLGLYFTQMESYLKAAYPSSYASHSQYEFDDVALMGWESANLFTEGLRAAGKNPTQASVIADINKIKDDLGGPAGFGVSALTNWTSAHTKDNSPSCVTFVTTQGTSNSSTASFKVAFNKGSDPWVCFPLKTKADLAKPVAPPVGTPGG
jgi:branched-chain amino acid transport system substrate-binding protein